MTTDNLIVPFRYIEEPSAVSEIKFQDLIEKWDLKLHKYKNAMETIRELSEKNYKIREDFWIEYFSDLSEMYDKFMIDFKDFEAYHYYEEGARYLYKDEHKNAYLAVDALSKAVIHASHDSQVLICSYIIRSRALYLIGYYQKSYEDCQALTKYLKNCGVKKILERVLSLDLQIAKDRNMDFLMLYMQTAQHSRTDEELQHMLSEYDGIWVPEKFTRKTDKVYIRNKKVVAKQNFETGDLIISENPYVLYAYADNNPTKICNNCGTMHWISYSCNICCGAKVVYCSELCKKLHKPKHSYECEFFKLNMHKKISNEAVLALRATIYGLIEMAGSLKNKLNAASMWSYTFGEFYNQARTDYSKFLNLSVPTIPIEKRNLEERLRESLEAELLTTFLLERSTINGILNGRAKKDQWKLYLSAILLYNMQLIKANARSMISVINYNFRCNPEMRFSKNGGIKCGNLGDMKNDVTQLAIAIYTLIAKCGSDSKKRKSFTQQNCQNLKIYAVGKIRREEEIQEYLYPLKNLDQNLDDWIKHEIEMMKVMLHQSIGNVKLSLHVQISFLAATFKPLDRLRSPEKT